MKPEKMKPEKMKPEKMKPGILKEEPNKPFGSLTSDTMID
jgi:hypothetical protein